MWIGFRWAAVALLALTAARVAQAQPADESLTPEARAAVVESLAQAIEDNYVLTEYAPAMAQSVRDHLAAGDYEAITSRDEFAHRLTADLRAVYADGHLSVDANPPLPPPLEDGQLPPPPSPDEIRALLGRMNFGFRGVAILPGNIGYLDLAAFMPPDTPEGEPLAREAAAAAMAFLAHTDAVIVDVRDNAGGAPQMVQFLCSYFFAEGGIHLNDIYDRPSDTTESFYTLDELPGQRLPDVPVYVLTSSATFSAAEEFAYNLQALERATIVGESTGGGAHPTFGMPLVEGFGVSIPAARSINPVTGTNWEGVGVQPDLAVTAEDALDAAREAAYETLLAAGGDEFESSEWRWALENLQAQRAPAAVDAATLASYVGQYGQFEVRLDADGALVISGPGTLTPMGGGAFVADNNARFTFVTDAAGEVAGLEMQFVPLSPPLYFERTGG